MKKKYPEKYEPGELAATRERLGTLSDTDAKKYAAILGGEIGVEKNASGEKELPIGVIGSDTISDTTEARFLSSAKKGKRMPYGQRVRIDFLCTEGKHRLKTFGNACLSLVPCLFPGRDYANPFFIEHLEELLYTNVENLVIAVRALLSVARFMRVIEKLAPYYRNILEVIAGWNIEGLRLDVVHLRQKPKKRQMITLRSMVRNLYTPMVRLTTPEDQNDLLKALRKLFAEVLKKGEMAGKRQRLETYYRVAKEEMAIVFGRIKPTFYPILLKVFQTGYYSYADLFTLGLGELCTGCMIAPEQLLTKENSMMEIQEKESGTEPGDEKNEEDETTESPESLLFLLMPRYGGCDLFADGTKLLEAMFPGMNFDLFILERDEDIEQTEGEQVPDVYAYFHPILPYPKGSGLCGPAGGLIAAVTLVLIIQELLQGFRAIDFGVIRDAQENPIGIERELRNLLAHWYRYIEEIYGKQYVPMLHEYCRNMEQDIRFRASPYGKRLLSELHWIVKHYFLPFTIFEAESGSRPPSDTSVPPLPEVAKALLELLSAVVQDNLDPDADVTGSIKNPKSPFFFEVETMASRRLELALKRNEIPADNIALVSSVYLLVRLLDAYIDNPLSRAYAGEEEEQIPYRNEGGITPLYSPAAVNTLQLLMKDERQGT